MRTREIYVAEISDILGLPYCGKNERITGLIKLVRSDTESDSLMTFCGNVGVLPEILSNPKIKALIATAAIYGSNKEVLQTVPTVVSESPMEAFYSLHEFLVENTPFYHEYDFPREVGLNCTIHPSSIVEDGVRIGNRVNIGPFSYIRKGTTIDDDCSIDASTVIGGEGFEVKVIKGVPRTVHHCGGVRIGRNVEIGSGCVIDKAIFDGATRIGENTKIDNLVQIAHDCTVGKDVLICANVQLSGNVSIADRCYLAPSVTVRDQIRIEPGSFIGIGAVVTKHISEPGTYIGIPAKRMEKPLSGGGL